MANIILVAWDDNKLIGNGNGLPWYLKEDLKLFKARTVGHSVVMGRKTWDSIGKKPLKDRTNIIVSGSLNFKELPGDTICYPDLTAAMSLAKMAREDKKDIFIIGGAQIYKSALERGLVDKMIVTHVNGSHEGDVYFPKFNEQDWEVSLLSEHDGFCIKEYTLC